jgi:CubicO group peptidase (beta-lactamase class C family)
MVLSLLCWISTLRHFQGGSGHADREAGIHVALDTVFRWASLTKPLVAASALALIERGQLDLDDPITRFLPDFEPRLPDGSAPTINVRHLLTHTAGLAYPSLAPDDPYAAVGVSNGLDQPGVSIQENLRRIASAPLYFRPGSAWRYSVATDVLGAIIAVVHGRSLADAVAALCR